MDRPHTSQRTSVGSYDLIKPLAKGGMARLFLGRHRTDRHLAAVKILLESLADNHDLRRRFYKEAQVIRSIRHPNVVSLYEVGTTDEGLAYLAMEYIDGVTLKEWLADHRRIPIRDVLNIAEQIAHALVAVHALGIAHRDLKPTNIMLIEDLSTGQISAKVLDFGIAKVYAKTAQDSHITKTGMILGTPLYMSPEQCIGDRKIDHRSDIYSLGVLLYRMVAGRNPFIGMGAGEVIVKQMQAQPRPPTRYRPELSRELEQVILRCMAKDPANRFQTMTELEAALRAELNREVARRATGSRRAMIPDTIDEVATVEKVPPTLDTVDLNYVSTLDTTNRDGRDGDTERDPRRSPLSDSVTNPTITLRPAPISPTAEAAAPSRPSSQPDAPPRSEVAAPEPGVSELSVPKVAETITAESTPIFESSDRDDSSQPIPGITSGVGTALGTRQTAVSRGRRAVWTVSCVAFGALLAVLFQPGLLLSNDVIGDRPAAYELTTAHADESAQPGDDRAPDADEDRGDQARPEAGVVVIPKPIVVAPPEPEPSDDSRPDVASDERASVKPAFRPRETKPKKKKSAKRRKSVKKKSAASPPDKPSRKPLDELDVPVF